MPFLPALSFFRLEVLFGEKTEKNKDKNKLFNMTWGYKLYLNYDWLVK